MVKGKWKFLVEFNVILILIYLLESLMEIKWGREIREIEKKNVKIDMKLLKDVLSLILLMPFLRKVQRYF